MKRNIALLISLLLFPALLMAETVTGVVKDASGEPLIGVNIVLKGSPNVGTITDVDGCFQLDLNNPQTAVLKFSYLGFETREVSVGAQRSINLVLEEAGQDLDDVVVVGYGTMKRRDLTGAVSSIAPKEITLAPTNNIMEALEGRIAGLDITQSSGALGSNPTVSLRGTRSIYGNNDPLVVIDGVIMASTVMVDDLALSDGDNAPKMNVNDYFSQLNPADIESIDVLKDAASTAIYGSAGANGVILITTRKGKSGKTTVNFDAYTGVKGTPMYRHGMQEDEWWDYMRTAYKNANRTSDTHAYTLELPESKEDAIQQLANGNTYYEEALLEDKWIDWVDAALDYSDTKATSQKYSLSVSSGNDASQVYSSISYTHDQGLMAMENADKLVLRLNADQQIFDWAKIGFVSNTTYGLNNSGNPVFQRAVTRMPLGEVYDEYGDLNYFYIGENAGNGQMSPLADWRTDQYANQQRSLYVQPTGYLEIRPVKPLTFKTQMGGSVANINRNRYFGSECSTNSPYYVGQVTPYAEVYTQNDWSYSWDNILTFNKTFAEDHTVTATALSSWNFRQLVDNYTGSLGQNLDSWLYYRMGSGEDAYASGNFKQTQQMSYAARLNYSYKGKYLLTASVRYDGVSWLSEGSKWDYFPSVAAAWRISDEGFMDGIEWLDNLKLRASYGVTGNSGGMSAYATSSGMYSYPQYISVDGAGSASSGGTTQFTGTYGNAAIGWEKSYTTNLGLDFTVLDNRIDGSVEWYDTQTKDLLYARAMPVTTGITGWGWTLSSWQNLGETMNRGLEVTLTTHNVRRQNFTWNTTFNLTWQTDKIVSLPGVTKGFKDSSLGWFLVGESINSVYDYKYVGIWQADELYDSDGDGVDDAYLGDLYGCEPGAVKIETVPQETDAEDAPGVHKYTENDYQVLGTKTPRYMAGLNNSFTYKNLDLSIYMMGRFGHLVSYSYYTGSSDIATNQPTGVDYWTEENTDAYYYAPGLNYNPAAAACNWVPGDFIKIKNITLGYTLPRQWTRKALVERCRIYGTLYNPYTWTKSKHLSQVDPESASSRYPLYRQVVAGLNITF